MEFREKGLSLKDAGSLHVTETGFSQGLPSSTRLPLPSHPTLEVIRTGQWWDCQWGYLSQGTGRGCFSEDTFSEQSPRLWGRHP